MDYNVTTLLQEPLGAIRAYELDDVIVDPLATDTTAPVRGGIEILRTNRGVLVTGTLASEVTEECSRCLEPYVQQLAVEIEEEFLSSEDVPSVPEGDVLDDDYFKISPERIVDLTEAVRQAILLARPMKPLCKEACAGLCQQCGANLNKGRCNCPEESEDSHWAKLKELLK